MMRKRLWTIPVCLILMAPFVCVRPALAKSKPKPPTLAEQYKTMKMKGPDAFDAWKEKTYATSGPKQSQELTNLVNQDYADTFTQQYYDMKARGGDAFEEWKNQVEHSRIARDRGFLKNLEKNKNAQGGKLTAKDRQMRQNAGKPHGFNGDPNDPGPTDWSDYIIETDGKGNVTGFKPKDWYERDFDGDGKVSEEEQNKWDNIQQQKNMDRDGDGNASLKEIRQAEKEMDTNGDGKISDAERKKWNDKRKKERKEEEDKKNGGPPGGVPPIPGWDQNGDGKPDNGFTLDCWVCKPSDEKKNECHYSPPGSCKKNPCSADKECQPANETHNGKEYECHKCIPKKVKKKSDFCDGAGYTSDPKCNGACTAKMCLAVDLDKKTGKVVPSDKTRERNSTVTCYRCRRNEKKDPCADVTCPSETECAKYECVKGKCEERLKTGDCNDGDACTEGDHCVSGKCEGKAVKVEKDTQCVTYSCDAKKGVQKKVKRGASCDDGDKCTGQDKCQRDGSCKGRPITGCGDPCYDVHCPADTACTSYKCVEGDCLAEQKTGSCDDKNACTTEDHCVEGACTGSPSEVPANTACIHYSCDPKKGMKKEIQRGASCDDGDKCTGQDKCQRDGSCKGRPITGCQENKDCAENVPGSTANSNCDGKCSADQCEATPVYGDPTKPKGIAYYCYKCKESESGCTSDKDCDDGQFCNGAEKCSGGECVQGAPPCPSDECNEYEDTCKKKRKCKDISENLFYQPGCATCYTMLGGDCHPVMQDDDGVRCFECLYGLLDDTCEKKNKNWYAGVCPGTCKGGQQCIGHTVTIPIKGMPEYKDNCHECITEESVCEEEGYHNSCPEGQECIHVKTKDGLPCCDCKSKKKKELPCPPGATHGGCLFNGGCPQNTKCRDRSTEGADCHICQPITGGGGDETIGSMPGGGQQIFQDGFESGDTSAWGTGSKTSTSVPGGDHTIGSIPGGGGIPVHCPSGQMTWSECGDCMAEGGRCEPTVRSRTLTSKPTAMCYICQKNPLSCPAGQVSGCQFCDKGTTCVPGKPIIDPKTGEIFHCHRCLPGVREWEATYIVIIVETPRGRYILRDHKGPLDLGDFKASQVMQLARAKSAEQAMQQIGSMLPTGGFNIPGLISGGMSMGNLTSLLQKSMEQGRKYGDDCFGKEDALKETKLPSAPPPPPSGGSSGGGASNSGKSQFGENAAEKFQPDGPMVACGEKDGKKALAVLDDHGRIVKYIFEDMLQKDPDAIRNALQRAQAMSDMIGQAAQGNWQSILHTMQQKAINKVTSVVDTKISGFLNPDKKEKIEPNDPFYRPPDKKGKKKKFLGILGSSKKAAPVILGTGLKMGMGNTLGASQNKYKKKEEKMDWQWGLHRIGYTPLSDPNSAWNLVDEHKKNVVVAIIDSGLDMHHKDAPEYIWTNKGEIPNNGIDDDNNGYVDDVHGWNFLDGNNDLTDKQGHGSFVAGIIAAKTNNGFGMAGINPGAVIMPVRVADEEGRTNSFLITRGIYYAVDNGARVINISLGSTVRSRTEEAAFRYAREKGVFIAVAAGNVGEDIQKHGPASAEGAFAVGALDYEGNRSTISNWGANNGILAPGDRILSLIAAGTGKTLTKSTREAGFYPQSGTSFSTPMVTATASLLLAQNPKLTNLQIADILQRTADDIYEPGWDELSGAGILNAKAALSENVNNKVTVKINEIHKKNNDRGRLESVDIYGTVRGKFKSFIVELGKGKHATHFEQVAGPYTQQANYDFIARLTKKEHLHGSRDWIVRIVVTLPDGTQTMARTPVELK